jgi:hypothetical protein
MSTNTDLSVSITAEFDGIADTDASRRTIDPDVAQSIGNLVEQNLRNRYADIDAETDIRVMAIEAGNVVIVETDASGD